MKTTDELPELNGMELSAVVFVRDYIQLQFDGPVLTAITLPTVRIGSALFHAGEAGYRDALCAQIGKVVKSNSVVEHDGLTLLFNDLSSIRISLRADDYRGAEAVNYRDAEGGLWVF